MRSLFVVMVLSSGNAWATSANVTTVYNFDTNTGQMDGQNPYVSMTLGNDGNFYGTTSNGGVFAAGTLFRLTPGGTETNLNSMGSTAQDGHHPDNALVKASDGNFYGTAIGGGGCGTVFKLTSLGVYQSLYNFQDNPDGCNPYSGLVEGPDGFLYGTTNGGGPYTHDSGIWGGTLYKISKSGAYSQVYALGNSPADGMWPSTGMALGADNAFYGTTFFSGPRNADQKSGGGTVFKLT